MLVEQWVQLWDSLVSLERRRLSCLALLALLGVGFTPVAARVVALLGFASEVVGEEQDEPNTPPRSFTALQAARGQLARNSYETQPGGLAALVHGEIHRCRQSLRATLGDEAVAALEHQLSLVDPIIMQNLPAAPGQV
jgi:hypothetical protein